jgi:hypothetical protein
LADNRSTDGNSTDPSLIDSGKRKKKDRQSSKSSKRQKIDNDSSKKVDNNLATKSPVEVICLDNEDDDENVDENSNVEKKKKKKKKERKSKKITPNLDEDSQVEILKAFFIS